MAPGAVRFPATPELPGYPLRCRERRKRKGKRKETARRCVCVAVVVPLACVLYKAMRWNRKKEKVQEQRTVVTEKEKEVAGL